MMTEQRLQEIEQRGRDGYGATWGIVDDLAAEIRRLWAEAEHDKALTCGCGIYVHHSLWNPAALHIHDCPFQTPASAASDTLPALPEGWHHVGGPDREWAGMIEYRFCDTRVVIFPSGRVSVRDSSPLPSADLITVLRHAEREQRRLAAAELQQKESSR